MDALQEESVSPIIPNPKHDRLTIEMFMNNNYYTKYLSKADPRKYKDLRTYYDSIRKQKKRIMCIFEELLEHPDKQIHIAVDEKFHEFIAATIKFLEVKDLEERSNRLGDEVSDGLSSDDNVSDFGEDSQEELNAEIYKNNNKPTKKQTITKSFFGLTASKLQESKSKKI